MNLVKPLYQHATHILSFLPPSEVSHRANADRDAFFEALGIQFTRAQLLEQATTMGIKPNTALTWLKRLVKQGLIVNLDGKGTLRARTRVRVLGKGGKSVPTVPVDNIVFYRFFMKIRV